MRIVFRCDPALADVLPQPVPARAALPDWLRAMRNRAFSPTHGQDVRTVSGSHDATTATAAQPAGSRQLSPATPVGSMITKAAAVSSASGWLR